MVAVAKRRQPAYKRRSCVRPTRAGTAPGRCLSGALPSEHWRRELEALDNGALSAKRRGPKPDADKAHTRRVEGLERDMERLRHKLERAEQIIDAQKKLARCWAYRRPS